MTVDSAPKYIASNHRSPGLTIIYNEIKDSPDCRILDLGMSSGTTFRFFQELSCNIHFESIDEFLTESNSIYSDHAMVVDKLEHYLTQYKNEQKFDVILTWDLFDYLDLKTIQWFMERLTKHCKANTILHIMKCVNPSIPTNPRHFQIQNKHQLKVTQIDSSSPRVHPSHNTAELLRHIPHFYMVNAYLNIDGMIPGLSEDILRVQTGEKRTTRNLSSDELEPKHNHFQRVKNASVQKHTSMALPKLIEHEKNQDTSNILNLGPKNNSDIFCNSSNNLYSEDLYQQVKIQIQRGLTPTIKAHMLNFPQGTKFNTILAWDTLNYLPTTIIEELFEQLSHHMHDNTLVHVILYSGKEIPEGPQQFHIRDDNTIDIYPVAKRQSMPPLTSTQLIKAMKHLTLVDTFSFRPGMRPGISEYTFKVQPNRYIC